MLWVFFHRAGKIHRSYYVCRCVPIILDGVSEHLVEQIESEDVKFIYLKALACIRAGNKDLAFDEIENAIRRDPNNVEVLILKGKLLWSMDKVEEGNELLWDAHKVDPNHHEVIEFLSIQKPRAEEFYK